MREIEEALAFTSQGVDPEGQAQVAGDAFNRVLQKAFEMAEANRGKPPAGPFTPSPSSFGGIVGDNVKRHRVEAGWTQEQLADAMTEAGFKWKRITCAEVELDTRRLAMEELFALAALFAVPGIELMLPSKGVGIDLPHAVLGTGQMRELIVGRKGQPGEGGVGWPVAQKALGSPKHKVRSPAVDLWRARSNRSLRD